MESRKQSESRSDERSLSLKPNVKDLKKSNEEFQPQKGCKSMIPIPKTDRGSFKNSRQSEKNVFFHSKESSSLSSQNSEIHRPELHEKCMSTIGELTKQMATGKKRDLSKDTSKSSSRQKTSVARKMISDPLVFDKKNFHANVLSTFESDVQQISKIWLKTSNDLTNTLKTLKNAPSLDPVQFQYESVRIQMAIKQAKSLTLVKTRNVIAEAKIIMNHREMIQTELEEFLSSEDVKLKKSEKEKTRILREGSSRRELRERRVTSGEKKTGGTGDAVKEITDVDGNDSESGQRSTGTCDGKEKNKEEDLSLEEMEGSESVFSNSNQTQGTASCEEVSTKNIDSCKREVKSQNALVDEVKNSRGELENKNEIINQLQIKLAEFHEKIHLDQVLWKQIGKLKELIKNLQQNNKHLESQKKKLECKLIKMDKELERLVKLNHVLNQKISLMNNYDKSYVEKGETCWKGKTLKEENEFDHNYESPENILAEKQNLINQLNSILNLMKDQENIAQKQIAIFESKIQELEKNSGT